MSEKGHRTLSSCSCPFEVMRLWSTGGAASEWLAGWAAGAPIGQMQRRIRFELHAVEGSLHGSTVLSRKPAAWLVVCPSLRQSLQD